MIKLLSEKLDRLIERFVVREKRRKFRKMVLTYKKNLSNEQRKINHTPFALPKPRH